MFSFQTSYLNVSLSINILIFYKHFVLLTTYGSVEAKWIDNRSLSLSNKGDFFILLLQLTLFLILTHDFWVESFAA